MSDPKQALQDWIITTLDGESPGIGAPVYDRVPSTPAPDGPFPRVTIGPGQTLPGEDDDADCGATWEVFTQLDVWSRAPGYTECSEIAGNVRASLHRAEPTLTGYRVVLLEWQGTDYLRDPDGLTSRARIQIRALIDEDAA